MASDGAVSETPTGAVPTVCPYFGPCTIKKVREIREGDTVVKLGRKNKVIQVIPRDQKWALMVEDPQGKRVTWINLDPDKDLKVLNEPVPT